MECDDDLPDTQPVSQSLNNSTHILSPCDSLPYWGRLYPMISSLHCYDLPLDIVTDLKEMGISVGKGKSCDVVINEKHVGKKQLELIDNFHFEIARVLIRKTVKIKLHVFGRHGVIVNGQKVAKTEEELKKCVDLHNSSVIAFPDHSNGPCFDVFTFVDACTPEADFVPRAVSRNYHVTKKLGSGAFGEVHFAFNKEFCFPSAMKMIHFNNTLMIEDKVKANMMNEIRLLQGLDHPHIIKLIHVVENKSGSCMFLEYMGGKDLSHRLAKGCIKESLAKLFFYQLALAIKYLHNCRIIHRDIKPANVLLATRGSETIVKLADFGLSKACASTMHMKTVCGTKMYAAPELLLCGKEQSNYTAQVDIWSLGVLLYVSLSGDEPFHAEPYLIETHIMQALYVMRGRAWQNISVSAKSLIDSMLQKEPLERITIDGVLKDKWLKDDGMRLKLQKLYKSFESIDISHFNCPYLQKSNENDET